MRNRWSLIAVLAVVTSLCMADFAQAQLFRRGRGSSYSSPGYYDGGHYSGGYYGPNSGYYGSNSGFYNQGTWNNAWNNSNMGQGSRAYYPPNYDGNQYNDGNQGFNQGFRDGDNRDGNMGQRDGRAFILVRVPNSDAQVWFDDHRTQQGGTQRVFESPSLEPGSYTYKIRAKWHQGDQEMNQTRTVTVHPGQEARVDFTRSGSAGTNQGERLNQPNRQNQGSQNRGNQNDQNQGNQNQNRNQGNQNRDNQNPGQNQNPPN